MSVLQLHTGVTGMRDVDGVEVGLDSGRLAVTDIEDVE